MATKQVKKAWVPALFFFLLIPLFMIVKKVLLSLEERVFQLMEPFEGFRSRPYWDYKQYSIGYGTFIGALDKPKPNVTWSKDQAKKACKNWINKDLLKIRSALKIRATSGMLIALCSFSYNLGIARALTMVNRLNSGETKESVGATMLKYYYAGGKPNEHLKERRKAEVKIFLS